MIIMTRPKEDDFIYPDEKPDGTILGYLDKDAFIEAQEKYIDYLESQGQGQ
jgi:hypothetical protein